MRYDFKFSTESIESMMPWELDVEMSHIQSSIQEAINRKEMQG